MRREENPGRGADPVRLRRDRQRRIAGSDRRGRPQIQRAPDGPEHLRLLLYAQKPVRYFLYAIRRQGPRGTIVAERRSWEGDYRLQPLRPDGGPGERRAPPPRAPPRGRTM